MRIFQNRFVLTLGALLALQVFRADVLGDVWNIPGSTATISSSEIERCKIPRYSINVAHVQRLIEAAIGGKEASKIYEGLKVFGLSVRFPESARSDVEPIKRMLVPSPVSALIPLGQLAQVHVVERAATT